MKSSVKNWYLVAYPTDTDGADSIRPDATFAGAFNCLEDYGDIYVYLGYDVDSIVRERVFVRLAELMGVEYRYIYEQWLKCHTHSPIFDKNGNFAGYFVEDDNGRQIPMQEIEERYNNYDL